MKLRYPLIAGGVAAIAVAAVFLLPDKTEAPKQQHSKKAAARAAATPTLDTPAPEAKPVQMVMTESGLRPKTDRRVPKEWRDPQSGAMFREILDAVPNPEEEAKQELIYRKSRLRLTLADAAAACYHGGDSHDEIDIDYTLVVDKEIVRTENVRIKTSNIKDPAVERCMVDAIRDLRTFGDKIPNLREEQSQFVSLHDLYDRNQRDQKDDKKPGAPDTDPVAKKAN